MDCSPPGFSLSKGFPRQECWSGEPFSSPGHLLDPGIEPGSPALQAESLPSQPPGSEWIPCLQRVYVNNLLKVTQPQVVEELKFKPQQSMSRGWARVASECLPSEKAYGLSLNSCLCLSLYEHIYLFSQNHSISSVEKKFKNLLHGIVLMI